MKPIIIISINYLLVTGMDEVIGGDIFILTIGIKTPGQYGTIILFWFFIYLFCSVLYEQQWDKSMVFSSGDRRTFPFLKKEETKAVGNIQGVKKRRDSKYLDNGFHYWKTLKHVSIYFTGETFAQGLQFSYKVRVGSLKNLKWENPFFN